MSTVKKCLLILLPLCLFLASEVGWARYSAIMIDAENGNVLHENEANHAWYPASLTKVMTLYLTFEALNQGRVSLSNTIRVSSHASRQPRSKLGLRAGETISIEDAILAIVTRSANDAAVTLAEGISGSEQNFAAKMTEKAHALGMADTHFMNATGLPHTWQVTTSRDMGLLAYRIYHDFPNYYPYFSTQSFNFRGQELRATNKFTLHYPGAEGLKTGFTCGSGYNLISAASQNGKRLIGVVLGGSSSSERYQLMMNMMDDGFANKFDTVGAKNIIALNTASAGTPPYLLDCGNRSAMNVGDTEVEANVPPVLSSHIKHHRRGNAHRGTRAKTIIKARSAGKKAKGYHSPAKAARKPAHTTKTKAAPSRTRYHHP